MDYFCFSAFELGIKSTEILKYILPFFGRKNGQERGTSYLVLRSTEKYFADRVFLTLCIKPWRCVHLRKILTKNECSYWKKKLNYASNLGFVNIWFHSWWLNIIDITRFNIICFKKTFCCSCIFNKIYMYNTYSQLEYLMLTVQYLSQRNRLQTLSLSLIHSLKWDMNLLILMEIMCL